ncbi:hypothetical protein [Streptomyces boncukensis]|uniref:H-type lectin domain-containing protein n=1 Tax=Streptomyces boncukensis TaxID=2711219 RepID=A0A6G4WQ57_9ACTN|nr:hypothetical protein [Streptomyces boncukensis]NGO67228.1 hypothetical protein [Streptomyces boncukensis]
MSMILTGKLELRSDNGVETTGGDTSTFTRVNFPTSFPAGSEVIVHAQVQTFNGAHTPGLRLADVSADGFLIRMNEIYATNAKSDGTHGWETVGWTAHTV